MQVILRTPWEQNLCLDISKSILSSSLESFKDSIYEKTGISPEDQFLLQNGKIIKDSFGLLQLTHGSTVDLHLKLNGGKGGFGSLLRGQAIAKRKITNFDASRDLQGRRIRNVTMHKKMLEWVKKKKEEDERIQKEIDEFKSQQKQQLKTHVDIRLTQEFKDKIETWDSELTKSVKEGMKRKASSINPKDRALEDGEHKADAKKKVHKNSEKPEGNASATEGHSDKILSKLSKIMSVHHHAPETVVVEEKKVEVEPTTVKVEDTKTQNPEKIEYPEIDLTQINSVEDLVKLGPDHVKNELTRLGLKCGGSPQDRAQRLFDIKQNPSLLFHPKYIAKK